MVWPCTLATVSRRFTPLPMIFQSFGSLSLMSVGGSILDAAAATLPNVVLRPEAVCVMTPFAAVHSVAGTFHSSAAAWMSIMRAAAPPLRTTSWEARKGALAHLGPRHADGDVLVGMHHHPGINLGSGRLRFGFTGEREMEAERQPGGGRSDQKSATIEFRHVVHRCLPHAFAASW